MLKPLSIVILLTGVLELPLTGCSARDTPKDAEAETLQPSRSRPLSPEKSCQRREVGREHYLICNEPRPWPEAREVCETQGMVLAQFVDALSMAALGALLKRDFWLGGSDRVSEGEWRWTDGTPFKRVRRLKKPDADLYTAAYVHESFANVKVDFALNCLRWHVDRWDAHRCTEALPFVCQARRPNDRARDDSRASCTTAERAGHRYLVCSDARTWQEAEAHCNRNDMHLATLQSDEESQFVAALIRSDSFIGLIDTTASDFKGQFPIFGGNLERGIWRNLDDNRAIWCGDSEGLSTPLSYTQWAESEPRKNLGCSAMLQGNRSWRAASCSKPLAYVCEQIDEGKPDAFATRLEMATVSWNKLAFLPGTFVTAPLLSLDDDLRLRACVDLYSPRPAAHSLELGNEARWHDQTIQGYEIGGPSGHFDVTRDLGTQAVRSMWIASPNNLDVPLLPPPKLSERQALDKLAEILGVPTEKIARQGVGRLEIVRNPRVADVVYELAYRYVVHVASPKLSGSDTHYVSVSANDGQLLYYDDGSLKIVQ